MTDPATPPHEAPAPGPLHQSAAVRWLLWGAGVVALALGVVGIVLPGLPTTPFVLLAAACFVRASPRAHAWLLANPMFGPIVRQWEANRSISPRVKRTALLTMAATGLFSAWWFADRPWLQALVLAGVAIGTLTVWRLRTAG